MLVLEKNFLGTLISGWFPITIDPEHDTAKYSRIRKSFGCEIG
jgi:methionine salvage enolase-phosphatase E1